LIRSVSSAPVSQIVFISSKNICDLALLLLSARPRGFGVPDTGLRSADVSKGSSTTDCGRGLEENSLVHFFGFDCVLGCAGKQLSQILRKRDLIPVNLHFWHLASAYAFKMGYRQLSHYTAGTD
jgi:hypothetical protein